MSKTVEERATSAAAHNRTVVHVGAEDFYAFARLMGARTEPDESIEVYTKHGKVKVRP